MSKEKIVEASIGLEDKIQKNFDGYLDDAFGLLLLSKKKLLFIREKGLFRKSYNLVLDLPYEKIKSLRTEGKYNLIIEDAEDLKHTFKSTNIMVSIVENALRKIMEQF